MDEGDESDEVGDVDEDFDDAADESEDDSEAMVDEEEEEASDGTGDAALNEDGEVFDDAESVEDLAAEPEQALPPVNPQPAPAAQVADALKPSHTACRGGVGTVRSFDRSKGFGYIQPDQGGPDVFVHISAVERAGLGSLNEGQKVSFEGVQDARSGKCSAGQPGAA